MIHFQLAWQEQPYNFFAWWDRFQYVSFFLFLSQFFLVLSWFVFFFFFFKVMTNLKLLIPTRSMNVALLENKLLPFSKQGFTWSFKDFFFSLLNWRCNPEKCREVPKVNRIYTTPEKNEPFLCLWVFSHGTAVCDVTDITREGWYWPQQKQMEGSR